MANPPGSTMRHYLVAVGSESSTDEVWYEAAAGDMNELTAAHNQIDVTKPLILIQGFQKCFIVNSSTFKVIDFLNHRVETADIGSNLPDKGTVLTQESSDAQIIVEFVELGTSPAAKIYGFLIGDNHFNAVNLVTGTNNSGDAVSFTPADLGMAYAEDAPNPPHLYTWTPYAQDETTYGSMPDKASLGCLYRGRLVLSGNKDYPHQWYMSRQANPWDWSYAANDAQAAIAGNNADAGEIGDIITALIPYKDDFLIFGCGSTIWRLNGDPAAGGSIIEVSLTTGIFGAYSWCWDDKDNLFFLGTNGLYVLSAEIGAKSENISKDILPEFPYNWNLNRNLHRVTMGYDAKRHGILICKTLISDGTNENYWFDLRTKGFFPETYPEECAAFSIVYYNTQTPTYRDMIIGGKDGYLRKFNDSSKDDNIGTTIETIKSYVVIGPNLISPDAETYTKFTSLSIVSAIDTDSLTFQIFTGSTAEKVKEQLEETTLVPRISGTISEVSRPHKIRQRVRGIYGAIRLSNITATSTWSMETIVGNLELSGSI